MNKKKYIGTYKIKKNVRREKKTKTTTGIKFQVES